MAWIFLAPRESGLRLKAFFFPCSLLKDRTCDEALKYKRERLNRVPTLYPFPSRSLERPASVRTGTHLAPTLQKLMAEPLFYHKPGPPLWLGHLVRLTECRSLAKLHRKTQPCTVSSFFLEVVTPTWEHCLPLPCLWDSHIQPMCYVHYREKRRKKKKKAFFPPCR